MLLKIALKSLQARLFTVVLTILAITISVYVLLAVEHIKSQAKSSFTQTVSGVDLIVGARTGQLNLLLYSVFRIGNATNNITWDSYQTIAQNQDVAWSIPISLGDSHRGFRVMGTDENYFKHFNYADKQALEFSDGQAFASTFEAVVGSKVAQQLAYELGDKIILSHGVVSTEFSEHKNNPFTIVGILQPTGTPVDHTVHARLDGIEAIHIGWESGTNLSGLSEESAANNKELKPKTITAFMLGLNSKFSTFTVQRSVNQHKKEALMAILPGVALAELWQIMGTVEILLAVISWLVLFSALTGMITMMLAAMRERMPEFFVLRAIGANPLFILVLVLTECFVIVLTSVFLAILFLWFSMLAMQNIFANFLSLHISSWLLSSNNLTSIGLVVAVALLASSFPALMAYRRSNQTSNK